MTRYVSDHLAGAQIAVIGGGAIGAALTYRLAQAGAAVTIVEERHPGAGTSGRSFAWLNGFRKQPREYQQLNGRSIREHDTLRTELGGDWLHVDGGIYWMHDDDPDAVAELHRGVRQMREWGYRVDRVGPEVAMRELEPDLAIDRSRVSEVYVFPNEGWVETVRMTHALVQAAATRYGTRVVHASVRGLIPSGHGVSGVLLSDGAEISADIVVNAAGVGAAALAKTAGVTLPIRRQPGVLFVTEPAPLGLRHVVHTPDGNLRPDGGGRVMFQREAFDSEMTEDRVVAPDDPLIARALTHARRIAPALDDLRIEAVRVGVRPMPLDGHPIVGFERDVPGLYEVVTHSGVTLCAILARLVTEELSGGSVPDLEPYRPERFSRVA